MISVATELSAVYTLVSPNGFRAVFNNVNDPDYVGFISEITGLDSAEIREEAENRPRAHGGLHGSFLFGRRPMTMTVKTAIHQTGVQRTDALSKLGAAVLDCLEEDGILSWTQANGQKLFISVRTQQPLRTSGAWAKESQIAMVAEDPYIYSYDSNFSVGVNPFVGLGWSSLKRGFLFPTKFPIDATGDNEYLDQVYSATTATNNGSAPSAPRIQIDPTQFNTTISGGRFIVQNDSTGEMLVFDTSLPAGVGVTIDLAERTIVSSTGQNLYRYLNVPASTWWSLKPGNNNISFQGNPSGAVNMTVYWRNAWK